MRQAALEASSSSCTLAKTSLDPNAAVNLRTSGGARAALQQHRALKHLLYAARGNSSGRVPVERLLGYGVAKAEFEYSKGRGGVDNDGIVVLHP